MSVDKSRKKPCLLKAQVLAIQLLTKTIDICSSKDKFPIRKKWAIPSDLYYEAREFCVNFCLANDIKVNNAEEAKERFKHDELAKEHIKRYLTLNNIAVLSYPLGESTINSWLSLMNEAYEMFNKWYASDRKRCSEYTG